jgi:hypothetical protein
LEVSEQYDVKTDKIIKKNSYIIKERSLSIDHTFRRINGRKGVIRG